jgi:hypothetical protein
MADDTTEDATEELEQPTEELEQEDLPDELPEDPAALKEIAAKAISQVKSAKQRADAAQSEKERLEDNLEEQRTKANFWSVDSEAKRKELAELRGRPTKAAPPPEEDAELADLVTAGMKMSDLRRMWQQDAVQVANWKANQITQQTTAARSVVNEYPDLTNDNSPLTKATIAEMEVVDREMPELSEQAKFELATRRSAARLGVAPRTVSNGKEEAERTRRRTGQGGPSGKAPSSKGAVVITDADRAMARKMNGGQDVPDKLLIEAKKRIGEQARA